MIFVVVVVVISAINLLVPNLWILPDSTFSKQSKKLLVSTALYVCTLIIYVALCLLLSTHVRYNNNPFYKKAQKTQLC